MAIFDGHLYPAYGDYDANTGPIDVVSLDLATQEIGSTEVTLHTEQTWSMRQHGDKLYVPFVDPQGGNDDPSQGQLTVADAAASWTVLTNVIGVTHAFDNAQTTDGLFLFGSNESDPTSAAIWRSTDDGDTWAETLVISGTGVGNGPRFYTAAQFGDDLIAYAIDADNTARAYRWAPGGSEWTEITSPSKITDTLCPFEHNGTAFWIGVSNAKDTGPTLDNVPAVLVQPADDAQATVIAASLPDTNIYDAATDGTTLYLLGSDMEVWAGDTAGAWTSILTLTDITARSIAVDPDGGYLYFGTTDSRILRTPIPT